MIKKLLAGIIPYKDEVKPRKTDLNEIIFNEESLREAANNYAVKPTARLGLMEYLFELDSSNEKHEDIVKELKAVFG